MPKFKEEDHKRDGDGKFSSTGGGGSGDADANKKLKSQYRKAVRSGDKERIAKAEAALKEADVKYTPSEKYKQAEGKLASIKEKARASKSSDKAAKASETYKECTTTPERKQFMQQNTPRNLSEEESEAVIEYKEDSVKINYTLRDTLPKDFYKHYSAEGKARLEAETKAHAEALSGMLDRASLSENVTTFRGVSGEFAKSLTNGSTWTDKAFTSSSLSEELAMGFAGSSGAAQHLMRINMPKGAKASALPKSAAEYEVVAQRGSSYKVTGVTMSGNTKIFDVAYLGVTS